MKPDVTTISIRGLFSAFGTFQTYYESALLSQYTASDIAWIGTIQGALMLFLGAVSGPLGDRGYCRAMVISSTMCLLLGHLLLGFSTEYYQVLLTQGVVIGVATGLTYVPSISVVLSYFTTRKPLALGIAATGISIGSVVYPVVFRQLQPVIGRLSVYNGEEGVLVNTGADPRLPLDSKSNRNVSRWDAVIEHRPHKTPRSSERTNTSR